MVKLAGSCNNFPPHRARGAALKGALVGCYSNISRQDSVQAHQPGLTADEGREGVGSVGCATAVAPSAKQKNHSVVQAVRQGV